MQKVHEETESALKGAADNMKRFYNRKHKFEEFVEGEKVYLNADHIVTGWPKKSLDWKWLGPFSIIKKVSPTAYKLQLPATWHMHPVFHILKLCHVKEDDFNRLVPKVTLNVHGENWALEKVLASWRKNNLNVMEQPLVLSYLILSTMPLLSYQMNYPTLQFGCYGTALYFIFYILSLFGLVDIIIRFDSCWALLHTADSMPSHYFILLTLKPYPYSV